MQLDEYVDEIRRQVAVAAESAGQDAQAVATRLMAPLDAAVQLALQHALADAADEITTELAPGSVEVRMRGRELGFAVTPPPIEEAADDEQSAHLPPPYDGPAGDEREMARINVRMPEHLKMRVEQAARAQGVSVNGWLVRAASAALDYADAPPRREERGSRRGPQQYRGWVR